MEKKTSKNILLIIMGILILAELISYFYESIMLLTLMIAYLVRYKEHQEAGLMDAPKK